MDFDIEKYLQCILQSHRMKNVDDLVKTYMKKRDQILENIGEYFKEKIYNPLNSGSYAKFTAINKKFDMDICIPFKSDSYETLKEMYEQLYNYFNKDYRLLDEELISVKQQKVSIGLEFKSEKDILKFDIVPGREIDNYPKDNDLNLYVNEDWGSLKKKSSIKTNIQKHVNIISDNKVAREPIKLTKVWKVTSNYSSLKSFFIELLCIRSLSDSKELPDNIWGKLKYMLEYIRDNIESIKLVDPANSNNIISDTVSDYQKSDIKSRFEYILNDVEKNEERIKIYFPVNSEFPCEEKKGVRYTTKESKATALGTGTFGWKTF